MAYLLLQHLDLDGETETRVEYTSTLVGAKLGKTDFFSLNQMSISFGENFGWKSGRLGGIYSREEESVRVPFWIALTLFLFLPWQPVKNDNFGYGREKANCLRRSWAPKVISCSLRRNHYRRDHLMNGINTGRSSLGLIISKRENKLSKAIGGCDIVHPPKYYTYFV